MTAIAPAAALRPDELLIETVERLLRERCPIDVVREAEQTGEAATGLWQHVLDAGLDEIGVADGDAPGGVIDTVASLRSFGQFAAPVPASEHGPLAGWLLRRAGQSLPGPMCTVPVADPADEVLVGDGTVRARFVRVPFARSSSHIVAAVREQDGNESLLVSPIADTVVDPSSNLAGEARDFVSVEAVPSHELPPGTIAVLARRASLGRVALMVGAMQTTVASASAYARERSQFGRPIAAFQAVQHLLALAAEHLTLADAACWVAADALAVDESDPFHRVDIARSVAHDAMETVTRHCHQTFGAIGVTKEHQLHHFTRRLWAWDLEWSTPARSAAALASWFGDLDGSARWGALTGISTSD